MEEMKYPVNLVLETTTACNLSCSICPHRTMRRRTGKVMPYQLYRKIIEELADNSRNDTIIWHAFMGEPTMATDLWNRIYDAKQLGIKNIWLNTNGRLAEPFLPFLADKIFVSIDAFKRETYEKIRCNGNFEMVVANTKQMLCDKPSYQEIIVQFIETPENKGELEEFKSFWLSLGASVKIRKMLGWGRSVADRLEYETVRRPCNWLARQMVVLNDGRVAQCDADYEGEYIAGDINQQTISEVWNGELKRRRDRHLAGDYDFMPCSKCDDWQIGISEVIRP
jgi:radical SAM protein with 4Fe4S-binding SPASM domain